VVAFLLELFHVRVLLLWTIFIPFGSREVVYMDSEEALYTDSLVFGRIIANLLL